MLGLSYSQCQYYDEVGLYLCRDGSSYWETQTSHNICKHIDYFHKNISEKFFNNIWSCIGSYRQCDSPWGTFVALVCRFLVSVERRGRWWCFLAETLCGKYYQWGTWQFHEFESRRKSLHWGVYSVITHRLGPRASTYRLPSVFYNYIFISKIYSDIQIYITDHDLRVTGSSIRNKLNVLVGSINISVWLHSLCVFISKIWYPCLYL